MPSASSDKQGTVVILTALPVEFEAVRTYGEDWQERECKGTLYEESIFSTGAGSWHVVIAQIGAGNVGAALEVERAITCFQPQVVFFVGVAGGVKDVHIGDVVVATKVHGYESGKETEHQFLPRPDMGQTSYRLVQQAQAVKRKSDWIARMKGRRAKLRARRRSLLGLLPPAKRWWPQHALISRYFCTHRTTTSWRLRWKPEGHSKPFMPMPLLRHW